VPEAEQEAPPPSLTSPAPGEPGLPEPLVAAKRALIGRPLETGQLENRLLPKFLALPIFSSDPISSVAYATEAALAVLVAASASAAHLVFPISAAIALLLLIVVLSYRQGIAVYQSSGGSYVFAKENLGTVPALVAAASLLTDYVLTVAVSVAAGIFAITSVFPTLASHKVALSLVCILVLTLGNLRGVRESGLLFAFPTYGFIASLYAVLGVGIVKTLFGHTPVAAVPHPVAVGTGTLTLFVLLKAFASGSAALTGVESISNGVTAFRRPQARNAGNTLLIMAAIAITLFLGVSYLAVEMHARPSSTDSVLSQVARGVFPPGSTGSVIYYLVQAFTLAILVLAANTSYQGFPRLGALLARDSFFPRQFSNLGDRLVYSNGILVLAGVAAALVVAFRADVDSLIHLYVIGVFTAFTLAQAGMVRHWHKTREPGWQGRALMNGVGATATLIVTAIVITTKFADGAWMVIVAIPVLVLMFLAVRRHYRAVGRRLRAGSAAVLSCGEPTNEVVVYVERLDAATDEALWYAREISGGDFHAVHVPVNGSDPGIRSRFFNRFEGLPHLEVLSGADGPLDALLEYVWGFPRGEGSFVTVVIPELFRKRSLTSALRRQTFPLKLRLVDEPGVVVTDVPRFEGESPESIRPKRSVGLVPISGVHAASLRALRYAETLPLDELRAVFFAFSSDEAERFRRDWQKWGLEMPVEIHEAPYRDLGDPLLRRVRAVTADPEAVAVVVMPELVVHGWKRLLHNQRALYVKRLLLFEPRTILSSVPYQLH
jgi:amino acid transporter